MCRCCEKKIRNLKNAKITPQTYIGKRFGNVVIIDCYWLYKSGRNRIYVDYKCDCGTIKTSNIEHLLQGHIISCGCVKTKRTIARNKKHGLYNDNRRLFDVWNNMIQRCENSKNNSFENYGKRGIKICKEWHDLKTFIDWAKSSGYEERDINNRSNVLSIERINVNGNYEPSNCKWIPVREQALNKRNSRRKCRKEVRRVIEKIIDTINNLPEQFKSKEYVCYYHTFNRISKELFTKKELIKFINEHQLSDMDIFKIEDKIQLERELRIKEKNK